jgi:acyl carrier protein
MSTTQSLTTAQQIREIVAEQLCMSYGMAADHESLSEKYRMDSLDRVEIGLTVEHALSVELDDDVLFRFDTTAQLIEAVEAAA